MTAPTNDGGSAFPIPLDDRAGAYPAEPGMTLRDYFIAHAPAEPQGWFEPVMPVARPKLPEFPTGVDASKNDVAYVREYASVMKPSDVQDLTLREYVATLADRRVEIRTWDNEVSKQRYVQWPAAWADAMLKARQA